MARQAYDTDLTDKQWEQIAAFFSAQLTGKRGRPRTHTRREIVNAILYIMTAGCVWRLLPHDLPPWKTVYRHLSKIFLAIRGNSGFSAMTDEGHHLVV